MFRTVVKQFSYVCDKCIPSNQIIKRYAGHSKWQNIRHIKADQDAERALRFTKLGRLMKVAVAENGSIDPKMNLKLHQIIEQAKRANMPNASIQSILKSCLADKTQAKSHLLEIKGPGSCFILCEVFTPNLHTLKQTIATLLRKNNSKYGDGGGVHCFNEKGIIDAKIETTKTEAELLDHATEDAIVAGAEEVKVLEEYVLQFSCGKTNLYQVVHQLESLGYQILSANVEYIPIKLQSLQDSELEICKHLCDKLEALPEVIRLSDNIA